METKTVDFVIFPENSQRVNHSRRVRTRLADQATPSSILYQRDSKKNVASPLPCAQSFCLTTRDIVFKKTYIGRSFRSWKQWRALHKQDHIQFGRGSSPKHGTNGWTTVDALPCDFQHDLCNGIPLPNGPVEQSKLATRTCWPSFLNAIGCSSPGALFSSKFQMPDTISKPTRRVLFFSHPRSNIRLQRYPQAA